MSDRRGRHRPNRSEDDRESDYDNRDRDYDDRRSRRYRDEGARGYAGSSRQTREPESRYPDPYEGPSRSRGERSTGYTETDGRGMTEAKSSRAAGTDAQGYESPDEVRKKKARAASKTYLASRLSSPSRRSSRDSSRSRPPPVMKPEDKGSEYRRRSRERRARMDEDSASGGGRKKRRSPSLDPDSEVHRQNPTISFKNYQLLRRDSGSSRTDMIPEKDPSVPQRVGKLRNTTPDPRYRRKKRSESADSENATEQIIRGVVGLGVGAVVRKVSSTFRGSGKK